MKQNRPTGRETLRARPLTPPRTPAAPRAPAVASVPAGSGLGPRHVPLSLPGGPFLPFSTRQVLVVLRI